MSEILGVIQPAFSWFDGYPPLIQILIGLVAILALGFLTLFLARGGWLWIQLVGLNRSLRRLGKPADHAHLARLFERNKRLSHLWHEYDETLHPQTRLNLQTGEEDVIARRATVQAETIFNASVIVDGYLRAEFFKHLPGIFTGVGIIATFSGLIRGLQAFQVSEDTGVVRTSLDHLLHGVGEAFWLSASAIGLAMLITLLEKLLLAGLQHQVDKIAQRLDGLFDAGIGEEYLARLVQSSEESASQARILKDSLVGDLKSLLTELTERQIAATASSAHQIARSVADSVENSLRDPVQAIAAAVQEATGERSGAVNNLLTDTLAAFGQRLQDLFGGQIAGINEAQQETMHALRTAGERLERLVESLDAAGRASTDALADKLAAVMATVDERQAAMDQRIETLVQQLGAAAIHSREETTASLNAVLRQMSEQLQRTVGAFEAQQARVSERQQTDSRTFADTLTNKLAEAMMAMEARQATMNRGLEEFLEKASATARRSQEDTNASVGVLLEDLGHHLRQAIVALDEKQREASDRQQARGQEFSVQVQKTLGDLGERVAALTSGIDTTVAELRAGAERLASATRACGTQLDDGARTILAAAGTFAKAGEGVSGVMDRAAHVGGDLAKTGQAFAAAAQPLSQIFSDHREAREGLLRAAETLARATTNAREEVGFTADVLARIESGAQTLAKAGGEADAYLKKVSEVLVEAHRAFATGVKETLREANTGFQDQLATSIGLLRGTIEELDGIFSNRSEPEHRVQ